MKQKWVYWVKNGFYVAKEALKNLSLRNGFIYGSSRCKLDLLRTKLSLGRCIMCKAYAQTFAKTKTDVKLRANFTIDLGDFGYIQAVMMELLITFGHKH